MRHRKQCHLLRHHVSSPLPHYRITYHFHARPQLCREEIVPSPSGNEIFVRSTAKLVGTRSAHEGIVSTAAAHAVIPVVADQGIAPVPTEYPVITSPAVDSVIRNGAYNPVIAGIAGDWSCIPRQLQRARINNAAVGGALQINIAWIANGVGCYTGR